MEDARKEAVRFVFITLENAVKYGSKNNCYAGFVKKKIDIINNDCTVITFNYEIMLERALPRGHFSYGIDIDKDKIINFPSYKKCKYNLLLLKLHGSLNWAVCSRCSKMYLFWSQRYDDIFKNMCKSCSLNLEAVLIPPTRVKSNHLKGIWKDIGLENLWRIAKEKITSADEITIIGYSFGEYDYEATGLILDAIKANIKNPILYIADPSAEKIYSKIANSVLEKNHFEKVCLFSGFKEYLTN
jgi:NAD-dependent SIR2 family protein deacetylase